MVVDSVGEVVRVGAGEVGKGVGNCELVGSTWLFGDVKKGVKVTVPRLKSFLLSKIDLLMADWSVVPHQLFIAVTDSEPASMLY